MYLKPAKEQPFQIAWESTLKCNLDCSYCGDGHDNSIPHPSITKTLDTVDFIIDYVSIIMKTRHCKEANLNIQGGESMVHPKILEILEYATDKSKNLDWKLNINTITNAVVKDKIWKRIVPYINFFTISFHPESTFAQQEQVRQNILYLKKENKSFFVSIMMQPKFWNTCIEMIDWCKENNIEHNPRQIDHDLFDWRFNYTKEQRKFLTGEEPLKLIEVATQLVTGGIDLSAKGRACCSGQPLCSEGTCTKYVNNKFKGWHCSVDKNFLYIRQTTGEVYTNKDCRMNWDGKVGPLGNLSNKKDILERLESGTDTIICKKSSCWCGLCAPKASTKEEYEKLIY